MKALHIASGAVIAVLIAATSLFIGYHVYTVEGSTIVGNEYLAQNVTAGSSTAATQLKTQSGSVGSVVLSNSSSATTITFYDTAGTATTTTATTTVLFTFEADATENTYVYDVVFNRGLLVDIPATFDGDLVVTYR